MPIPHKPKIISIILKCVVILAASIGTYLSAVTGLGGFMSGSTVFMYFTIQSNIAVALISVVGLILFLSNKKIGNAFYVIDFIGSVSITLTFSVFTFVLAPTLGDLAWTVHNILTHIIAPLSFIVDFFITAVYGDIRKSHIALVLIPPGLYAAYAGIGYAAGWEFLEGKHYPYFFLNWGSPAGTFGFSKELPFMGCVWWIAALGAVSVIIGAVYLWIVNKTKKRMNRQ